MTLMWMAALGWFSPRLLLGNYYLLFVIMTAILVEVFFCRLHTFISGALQLKDANFNVVKTMRLRDVFHQPMALLEGNVSFQFQVI